MNRVLPTANSPKVTSLLKPRDAAEAPSISLSQALGDDQLQRNSLCSVWKIGPL